MGSETVGWTKNPISNKVSFFIRVWYCTKDRRTIMCFDQRAATWDASDRRQALAEAVAEAIRRSVPLNADMRLLDFGAGTGLLTRRLAPFVGEVTAVDTSAGMLEKLAEGLADAHIRHVDIMAMPEEETFDLVVSSMTMHHIPDIDVLFEKLHTLLAPGGHIALADLAEEDGSFHDHGNVGVHHFGFNGEDLEKRVKKAGFADVACRVVHTVVKERGKYPIFLLSAKRR